jgi:hypothetical protein
MSWRDCNAARMASSGEVEMYWWNASKPAEDSREGRVDDKERSNYSLATCVVWSIVALTLPPVPVRRSGVDNYWI